MLRLLRVRNLAVVAGIEVELGEGLNLLTGETGAGKSIIVDALGLLLGERGSGDIVRSGEESASIEALVVSPSIAPLLESHGLPIDPEGEVVLRREVSASGRSRATVNGAIVPIGVLRSLAPHVAAIQGQHESQGLLDSDRQLEFLDAFVGARDRRGEMAALFRELRESELRLEAWRRDRRELERRRETLEFQLREIEQAHLVPGEEVSLRAEKEIVANADRLAELSEAAYGLLYDDEGAVLGRLGAAYKKIEDLAGIDPRFRPYLEARDGLRAQIEDLAFFLRDYRSDVVVAPGRQDEIEARLALIERLKRKYGGSVEEILAFQASCRSDLADLAAPEETEKQLARERERRAGEYLRVARAVSEARRKGALALRKGLEAELAALAMGKTRFEIGFTPERPAYDDGARWREHGLETCEFRLSPNPGEELRPLARTASGGELSRVLLALRCLLDAGDGIRRTLVFDEVDSGIGGAVAGVVGKKLRQLARHHQVVCVTHLPQIACLAGRHHRVTKEVRGGRTLATVEVLDGDLQVEEIARLLGGDPVTETARRHAREMIATGDMK